jgi:hypothetical protein
MRARKSAIVHFLGAQWGTMCGRLLAEPIEPLKVGTRKPSRHRPTLGRCHGLIVTWVPVDVTCKRCRGWLRLVQREG